VGVTKGCRRRGGSEVVGGVGVCFYSFANKGTPLGGTLFVVPLLAKLKKEIPPPELVGKVRLLTSMLALAALGVNRKFPVI
jgi:hypothetical protein